MRVRVRCGAVRQDVGMEECQSLDSEMTELQGFQRGSSETMSQDDEDEVEELQNRCFTLLI